MWGFILILEAEPRQKQDEESNVKHRISESKCVSYVKLRLKIEYSRVLVAVLRATLYPVMLQLGTTYDPCGVFFVVLPPHFSTSLVAVAVARIALSTFASLATTTGFSPDTSWCSPGSVATLKSSTLPSGPGTGPGIGPGAGPGDGDGDGGGDGDGDGDVAPPDVHFELDEGWPIVFFRKQFPFACSSTLALNVHPTQPRSLEHAAQQSVAAATRTFSRSFPG